MSRYEEATQEPYDIMKEVIEENWEFGTLSQAQIHIVFDTKKKKNGDKYVFARVSSTSEMQKYLSSTRDCPDGFHFILFIDKNVWNEIERADKKRLIFHELCHCSVDLDKKDPFSVRPHEIEQFEAEIRYNEDDPRWSMRLAEVAASIYDTKKNKE